MTDKFVSPLRLLAAGVLLVLWLTTFPGIVTSSDRWLWTALLGLGIVILLVPGWTGLFRLLAVVTLLALWAEAWALTTHDPEGKLFSAAFGTIAVQLVAPFWLFFRGRVPAGVVLLIGAAAIAGSWEVDAWAGAMARIQDRHFSDYAGIPYFCIPGLICGAIWVIQPRTGCHGRSLGRP